MGNSAAHLRPVGGRGRPTEASRDPSLHPQPSFSLSSLHSLNQAWGSCTSLCPTVGPCPGSRHLGQEETEA